MNKRLTKSNHPVFAGVLGGVAEYFGWDPTILRALYTILTVVSAGFPGVLVYLILMLVMPDAPKNDHFNSRPPRKDVTNSSSSSDDDDWSEY